MQRLINWRGNETLDGKVDSALIKLYEKTPGLEKIIQRKPPQNYIDNLSAYNSRLGYAQLKPRLEQLNNDLSAKYGEKMAMKYGLVILAEIIRENEHRWKNAKLDSELKPEFIDSFHRILTAVSRGGSDALNLNKDAYAKELSICLYRLVPAGGQLIDPGSGLSRKMFLSAPFRDAAKLFKVLCHTGGFAPFAEFHTDLFMRHWFTREGWEYSFRLLPAVFKSYPKLRGLVAGSWFFDPMLENISPELAFIRDVSNDWGASFVTSEYIKEPSDAILTSRTRRELFNNGQYCPRNYLIIVPKRTILTRI